jgi:hypothetical protein
MAKLAEALDARGADQIRQLAMISSDIERNRGIFGEDDPWAQSMNAVIAL